MASVNKVILVGNLGRDPETRTFPNGGQVCNVRIATTDRWKDKQSGEMRESTEWHSVAFHDRLAEIAGQYLRKGSQIYVEGQLRTRKWQDKDGQDRYTTEIRADQMQMLGSRQDGQGSNGGDGYGGGYGGDNYQRGEQRQQRQQPQQRQPQQRNAYADQRGGSRQAPPQQQRPATSGTGFDDMDDDIPF